jgi:hypothetical protein
MGRAEPPRRMKCRLAPDRSLTPTLSQRARERWCCANFIVRRGGGQRRARWPGRARASVCARRGRCPVSPCLAACARTGPVWRCSSSFTSAGKPAHADPTAFPERIRNGGPGASSRREGETRRRERRTWQNATPPENPDCHSGCRVDSCCDRRSAHCPDGCSTSRRARPFQTARLDVATQQPDDSGKSSAARGGGRLPRTPSRVQKPELQRSEPAEIGARKQGQNATPPENPDRQAGSRGEARRDRRSAH